jgi:hypothetical protein
MMFVVTIPFHSSHWQDNKYHQSVFYNGIELVLLKQLDDVNITTFKYSSRQLDSQHQ